MKKVVLLTSQYPYGKGETFIEPELKYGSKITNIDIVATSYFGFDDMINSTVTSNENIKALSLFASPLHGFSKLLWGIIAISHKCFWQEIRVMREHKKLGMNVLRETIAFAGRGERIYYKLRKLYKDELESNPGDMVFYSYWMLATAYAAAKLKMHYGCKAVTRTHGGDLYNERSPAGYQPLRRFLLQNLDGVYCISCYGKMYLESKYGFKDKVHISRLGTEDFGYGNTKRIDNYFVIVSCAYISPLKRIHLIALALKQLGMDCPNINIKWVHFGGGSGFREIENIILSFPQNVEGILMGDTMHKDIMDYYKSSTINLFVNTSSTEGIPVSIMEAMSFGIPVIATDVGGSGELVKDKYNGWLTPENITPKELAIYIKTLIDMPRDEYRAYGENARKFWENNYCSKKNYEEFYTTITTKTGDGN
jgi:colanic acid/amylovoran biosynthesis glycosyltransferase